MVLVGLCVLALLAHGVTPQALKPEEFCRDAPPVHRGKHFEIAVNQTDYYYNRGVEVTVRPRNGGMFSQISDMFLHVPGTDNHPGNYGTNSVGRWFAMPPAAPAYCNWWVASGVKSTNGRDLKDNITVTWIAPQPSNYIYNNQYYANPLDIERQRPYIYFVVYVTPDPPVDTFAPGAASQRRWFYAASVRVDNIEIKQQQRTRAAYMQSLQQWSSFMESFN
ncbi:uncharacterized shell protein 16-like [Haliotis cracherodii]|uniref:uncharacterized shell protein 16-like n=1 Tax=Haliotis cracherodii TaxID=6455 RepID=UPI0039EA6A19